MVVYLGKESDGSNEAMDFIQEIDEPSRIISRVLYEALPQNHDTLHNKPEGEANLTRSHRKLTKTSGPSRPSSIIKFGKDNNTAIPKSESQQFPSETTSMQALSSRPWFSRVWVLQEIRMANKSIVQVCSNARNSYLTILARSYYDHQESLTINTIHLLNLLSAIFKTVVDDAERIDAEVSKPQFPVE